MTDTRRSLRGMGGDLTRNAILWISVVTATCWLAPPIGASLTRNAAGARNMGDPRAFTLDTAGELEREPDESAWLLETAIQWQATGRIQALVEAVAYESRSPDSGDTASGLGDTDVTFSWLALEEHRALLPVVLAARVKLPTASSDELGTGKVDFSGLLIVEKEIGELELAAEAEYATFGSPPNEELDDQLIYTFTAEYGLSDLLAIYAEVFGNSKPSAAESRTDAGLLGVEIDLFSNDEIAPYVSFEFDTEAAGTVRAGIEWTW